MTAPTTTGNLLDYCPGCRFDQSEYRRIHRAQRSLEDRLPRLVKDPFTKLTMVYCPNCGLRAIWSGLKSNRVIARWNAMTRVTLYHTPMGPIPWDRFPRADGTYLKIGRPEHRVLDRLSRSVISMARDGNARLLADTGHIMGKKRKLLRKAICRRLSAGDWKGYSLRWSNPKRKRQGLYFHWWRPKKSPEERRKWDIDNKMLMASGDGMTEMATEIRELQGL